MSDTPTAPATAPVDASPTTPEGGQDQSQQQPQEPKKKAPSYRKIKVGNEEVALSDEDIARDYGKWKSADSKFREAAEARKSVDAFMKALEEDPEKVLSDKRLPLNKKKLAEKWLMEQIEEELNPPDPKDQKLSEAEKKLKAYEDKEKAETEAKTKQEHEAVLSKRKEAISKTLAEAMEMTHLSKHPESAASTLREMALYMRAAKERGEDVSPQELVEHIHNNRFHQMYTLAQEFQGEDLIEFLGEEIVTRIRKADLARLKAKREPQNSHKDESWTNDQPKKKTKMDPYEAREHANRVLFGKK
jgi:hypothetical protein